MQSIFKRFHKYLNILNYLFDKSIHFYVEFDYPETMEVNKEALESLEVNGEH